MKHRDGSPHIGGIPVRVHAQDPTDAPWPMGQAVILRTYPVGDDGNRYNITVECDIATYSPRQIVLNVPVRQDGGARDCDLWTPNPTTRNLESGEDLLYDRSEEAASVLEGAQLKDLDGDHVVVAFLDGRADKPFVLCGLPHPHALYRSTETGTAITAASHPVTPDGHCRFLSFNGTRIVLDRRGTLAIDTTGAGTLNNGDVAEGAEPKGEVYINLRSGERLHVAIAGSEKLKVDSSGVVLVQGTKGVARLDDAIRISLTQEHPLIQAISAAAIAGGSVAPATYVLDGTIVGASSTVKAG